MFSCRLERQWCSRRVCGGLWRFVDLRPVELEALEYFPPGCLCCSSHLRLKVKLVLHECDFQMCVACRQVIPCDSIYRFV